MLDAGPATPSLAEYHRAILRALGVRRPPPKLLWELEQPGARPPVEPFPEVPGVLERLRAGGVRMAIVSDNWPGLEHLYRNGHRPRIRSTRRRPMDQHARGPGPPDRHVSRTNSV